MFRYSDEDRRKLHAIEEELKNARKNKSFISLDRRKEIVKEIEALNEKSVDYFGALTEEELVKAQNEIAEPDLDWIGEIYNELNKVSKESAEERFKNETGISRIEKVVKKVLDERFGKEDSEDKESGAKVIDMKEFKGRKPTK